MPKSKKPATKCCRTCAWYDLQDSRREPGGTYANCSWPCPHLPDSADFKYLPKHAMWPTDGTTCACWAERKRAKP